MMVISLRDRVRNEVIRRRSGVADVLERTTLGGVRGTAGRFKMVKEDSPVETKNYKKKCG